jgi:hypothetical protein
MLIKAKQEVRKATFRFSSFTEQKTSWDLFVVQLEACLVFVLLWCISNYAELYDIDVSSGRLGLK